VRILDLLDQVELGTISATEAAARIRSEAGTLSAPVTAMPVNEPSAKWLKIKIVDPDSNFKLHLPPLPLRFTGRLASILISAAYRHTKDPSILNINRQDLEALIEILKHLPPVNLVSVQESRGTVVEIYTR
jgi:hypothetical protein